MPVLVKICGVTSLEQALMIEEAGADAIGLVLYEKSTRHISLEKAIKIRKAVSPKMICVALLVNAQDKFIRSVITELEPDLIQFHGDESADFCHKYNYPFIRAIRMRESLDISVEVESYRPEGGFLFDAWHEDHYGGTGEIFDWDKLPKEVNFPLILAGGLTPNNVKMAVDVVDPYMVDVSGGVESIPGLKDELKVKEFIRNAKGI